MTDWYIEFMILIFQDCFVTRTLEIVTSQWNVSTSGLSESGPILKAVVNYCIGHWVWLLEVYEIFKDIEGFTLYLKSKFFISRCMNRRENFFFSGIDMLYVEHASLFINEELMHFSIQKLFSINTSRWLVMLVESLYMYVLLKSLPIDTVVFGACCIALQSFIHYRIRACKIDVEYASYMLIWLNEWRIFQCNQLTFSTTLCWTWRKLSPWGCQTHDTTLHLQ